MKPYNRTFFRYAGRERKGGYKPGPFAGYSLQLPLRLGATGFLSSAGKNPLR
jgi:hypothetical protein